MDRIFHALSDPTRLAVVARLSSGPASVGELAQPFSMALPSFTQHLKVLEQSQLVSSEKKGRARIYQLRPRTLATAEQWLQQRRRLWEQRLDQLDDYLQHLQEEETP
ncbi:ArsR/SmtB family transcription factor [Gilvimarinus sp. F26214L]|uniref:ArsR/SmtB family transcription factor n=1 Tax=Gilvimarinus sp. DZF01 TaxID=3461371 RepID=UPI0040465065